MQPNYTELMRRQQEDYQRSRNPFEYGRQVAQRRYSQIMSDLDARTRASQRSYGDMYQAARQRAVGQQAMGGPTLSGGMGQQRRDFVSALGLQEIGKISAAGAQAEADLYAQGQAAFSNAQLEGQQATQMELQNRTAELQLTQQRQAIQADNNLTTEQKREQLEALGSDPQSVAKKNQTIGSRMLGGAAVGAGGVALTAGVVSAGVGLSQGMAATKGVTSAIALAAKAGSNPALAKSAIAAFKASKLGGLYMATLGKGASLSAAKIGALKMSGIVKALGGTIPTIKALGVGFGGKAAAGLGLLTASTGGSILVGAAVILGGIALVGGILSALKV